MTGLCPDIELCVDPQVRFEELYRAYADRVHAYALRRTTSSAADDVVADVFLVVWRRLDRVPDQPFPWLLGIARRVLANRRRSESRAAALRDRLIGDHRSVDDVSNVADGRIHLALAGLGDRDRELLLLIAWEGLRPVEAAEVLGVRPGTLTVRLYRARRRLSAALAAEDDDVSIAMEGGP